MKYLISLLISFCLLFWLHVEASFNKAWPYDWASDIYRTDNDKHYAYYVRKDGKYTVIHDGKKIWSYQWVWNYNDPRNAAYVSNLVLLNNWSLWFVAKENDKKFVIIDGKQWKKYDDIIKLKYFEETNEFVYVAQNNWKWTVVEWDKEWKYYDNIISDYIYVNAQDNIGYTYVAQKWDKQVVVMSWKESDEYDTVTYWNFTQDDKDVYYHIWTKWDKKRLVMDNWKSKYYDDISKLFGVIDWKMHFAYKNDEKVYAAIWDKTIIGWYENISSYTQSLDKSQQAYIIKKDNKESVWLNWKIQAECLTIDGLDFLSDNRIIYSCKLSIDSDEWYVQVWDEQSQIFEEFYYENNLQLSPDKKQYSYLVYYQWSRWIVDGKMFPTHSEVYGFNFLDSGWYEYIAYQYATSYWQEDRMIYVKDGKEVDDIDMISNYYYSEDKKNYRTIWEQWDKQFTYINGKKWKLYDSVYDLWYNKEKKYFQYKFEENWQYYYVEWNKISKWYSNLIGDINGDIVTLKKDSEQRQWDVYAKDEFKFSYTYDDLRDSYFQENLYIIKQDWKYYVWSYETIDNLQDKQEDTKKVKTKSQLMKQKIIARNGLMKQNGWSKFISQVDNLVKHYDSTDLNTLVSKLSKITDQQRKKSKYQHHLNYFEAIILLNNQ